MAAIEFKVCILGDVNVGKTSLCRRFTDDEFSPEKIRTRPVAEKWKDVSVDGTHYRFHIWDTAGEERYRNVIGIYYRGARVVVIVYDVTAPEFLTSVEFWYSEVRSKTAEGTLIVIVGNKCDLMESQQVVEKGEQFAAEYDGLLHFQTSAKTGENVYEMFQKIASTIKGEAPKKDSSIIKPSLVTNSQETKRRCC